MNNKVFFASAVIYAVSTLLLFSVSGQHYPIWATAVLLVITSCLFGISYRRYRVSPTDKSALAVSITYAPFILAIVNFGHSLLPENQTFRSLFSFLIILPMLYVWNTYICQPVNGPSHNKASRSA